MIWEFYLQGLQNLQDRCRKCIDFLGEYVEQCGSYSFLANFFWVFLGSVLNP